MKPHLPHSSPLLLPACWLAAGIGTGSLTGPLARLPQLLLLCALLAATLLAGRRPLVQTAGVWLCFFVLGLIRTPSARPDIPDGQWTEAVVASMPAERPKTVMTDLLLLPQGERRHCYLWKDERSRQLRLGDAVVVRFHDGQFIAPGDWRPGGSGSSRLSATARLRLRALQWREHLVRHWLGMGKGGEGATATEHTADADAQAVLAAMVLGDKQALTRELRESYSISGASHVLALSGLHLGIIYLLLTRLMPVRRRLWAGQVAVVVAIWAFALLTGLSVSVVRSAIMISLYALFSLGGRRRSPLGVLSFTAVLMLLCDARALSDIGFQLSFMAMLSILLFMPLFEGAVSPRWMMSHPVVRWLYGLTTVSLAAQMGTAPLVAYHFGRFSTWFLLTNLVAVPAATLMLYGAAIMLVVPAVMPAVMAVARGLNSALGTIARLPCASIEGLSPTLLQVALAYLLLGVVYMLVRIWRPARR